MNGILEMILSTFSFSLMTLSVKLSSLNTANIIFYRSLIQFLITSTIIQVRSIPFDRNQLGVLLWRGIIGAIEIGLFYYSIQHLKLEDATIIFLSAPILTSILSYLILKEPIYFKNILSLILCLGGSFLVAAPQIFEINIGILSALGGAIASSIVYILIKCLKCHAIYSILSFNIFSGLIALVQLTLTESIQVPNDPWLVSIIGFSYVGQYYLNTALQKIPASTGTLIVNLDVFFAFVYSITIFKSKIEFNSILGAILVVMGSLLSARSSQKQEISDEEAPLLDDE
eukprot:NODE_153_length_16933_cov_0.442141.p7 type:complete len:286 gc:universal NODE_153_length_16933_cov_0.442141:15247-14390(-)